MGVVDDFTLLERSRRGDEAAFSQLFAAYQRKIFRYAACMCGRDAGDDIVQETFLVLLRQTGRRDPPSGSVLGYLFGIARHLVWKRHGGLPNARVDAAVAIDQFAAPERRSIPSRFQPDNIRRKSSLALETSTESRRSGIG